MNFFDLNWYIYVLMLIGVILIVIGALRFGMFIPNKIRGLLVIIGVILLFAPFASAITPTHVQAPPQSVVSNPPTIVVSAVSGVKLSSNVLTADVTMNFTSGKFVAPTGGVIKFDIKLISNSVNTTFPTIVLGSNPQISNSTSSKSAYLVTQYSNNSLEATFVTPTTTLTDVENAGGSFFVPLKSADTAQVNVTMTLNAQAFLNLNSNVGLGASSSFDIIVAGQTYTINAVLI
jgi:hypothetical protein